MCLRKNEGSDENIDGTISPIVLSYRAIVGLTDNNRLR